MRDGGKNVELKTPELLLFAWADVYGGGGGALISVLYLVFLTNILGINPAWAGAVVMISKIWDAVSDPLMGLVSDNTRSRFGRRKPYIFGGGILLVLSMALLWLPVRFEQNFARTAYVTFAYLFYCTVATIICVPYSSMSAEITADFKRRNQVNMTRLIFSLVSTALCTLLPSALFARLNSGTLSLWAFYSIITLGFGLFFALPQILTGLFVRERVSGSGISRFSPSVFIKPLTVRAFRKLLYLYLAQAITLDVVSAVIIYYALYVIPGLSSTVFLGVFLGMQILLFPVLNKLVNRIGKTRLYRFGLPLSIAAAAATAFYPAGSSPMGIYVLTGFIALGFAGAQIMSWIIFPDVVDLGDLSLGRRITGSFSGAMTFTRKASSAIAIFAVGGVLGLTGFVSGGQSVQPAATVLSLRLIILLSFTVLMGSAWFVARSFRLNPELSRRVRYFLDKRENGGLEQLDEQERAELAAINKEFG